MTFEPLSEISTASYMLTTANGSVQEFEIGSTVEINEAGVLHIADRDTISGRNLYFAPSGWVSVQVVTET